MNVTMYEKHTKVLYIACLDKLPTNICYAVAESTLQSTMETSCFDKDLFNLKNQSICRIVRRAKNIG